MHDLASEFSKFFPRVIPPDPHSGRGRPPPAPNTGAQVLGPKPWPPSTFQPWLRPWYKRVLVKTNVRGGSHRNIGNLTQACPGFAFIYVYSCIHYIKVIYSGSSTRLLNHYYTRCTELEILWSRKPECGESTVYKGNIPVWAEEPGRRCECREVGRRRRCAAATRGPTPDALRRGLRCLWSSAVEETYPACRSAGAATSQTCGRSFPGLGRTNRRRSSLRCRQLPDIIEHRTVAH